MGEVCMYHRVTDPAEFYNWLRILHALYKVPYLSLWSCIVIEPDMISLISLDVPPGSSPMYFPRLDPEQFYAASGIISRVSGGDGR